MVMMMIACFLVIDGIDDIICFSDMMVVMVYMITVMDDDVDGDGCLW